MFTESFLFFLHPLTAKAKPIELEKAKNGVPKTGIYWAHLHADQPETLAWLDTHSSLDRTIIDALLAQETRPRCEVFDDGMLLILRGMNQNPGESPEDMISIRLWVDSKRIISTRKRHLYAVQDIEDKMKRGKGPVSIGDAVAQLVSKLADNMSPYIMDIVTDMDDIEERTIDRYDASMREKLMQLRQRAIIFKRYIAPQRDAISVLAHNHFKLFSDNDLDVLLEARSDFTRYIEDLDAARERAQIIHDELRTALSDKTNRNMYVLSVISAIFIPLTFIASIFGMNIGGIPGSSDPRAFMEMGALFLLMAGIQIILFKIMRWF